MSYQRAIQSLASLRFKRNVSASIGAETWGSVQYTDNALKIWKAIAPVPYAVIAQAQDSGLVKTTKFEDWASAAAFYDNLAKDSRPFIHISLWDRVDADANNPARQWPGIMDEGYYPQLFQTAPTPPPIVVQPAPVVVVKEKKGIGFGALAAILAGGVGTIALLKSKKGG